MGNRAVHLNIVGVSFSKFCGSDVVDLNEGLKLFYSGIDVAMSARAEVGIFVRPRWAH